MTARLRMIRLDFKRALLVALLFPLVIFLIACDSVFRELPPGETAAAQVWRYGMMLCQYLPFFFAFWPMLHLNSWIGEGSVESLRAAGGGRFACGPSLILIWCLQLLAFVPALVLGWVKGLNFLWVTLYVMLIWMLLLGIFYALVICLQSVALPMLFLLFYYLFGSFPGWAGDLDPAMVSFLNKLYLFDTNNITGPWREGGYTETFWMAVKAGGPYFLAGVALILLFSSLEKKRTRPDRGRKGE